MKVQIAVNDTDFLSDAEYANRFKSIGHDAYYSWDLYIIAMQLKPRIDAKEFFKLYNDALGVYTPETKEIEFNPNWFDSLLEMPVQVTLRDDGIFEMIWEDGCVGSYPPCYPPESWRYKLLALVEAE